MKLYGYYFTFIKKESARAKALVNSYYNSYAWTLSQVYNNWSMYKEEAYNECARMCNNLHGRGFKICTYNIMAFTAGFTLEIDNKNYLVYITKCNNYLIEL